MTNTQRNKILSKATMDGARKAESNTVAYEADNTGHVYCMNYAPKQWKLLLCGLVT